MKVSVILPYNQDRGYLAAAIAAAEQQDGMILGTDYEVITHYGDHCVSRNINDAVRNASGDYIKLYAEDDLLMPNCLTDLYTAAVASDLDLVCANAINFSDEPGVDEYPVNSRVPATVHELASYNTIHGGTVLIRTAALRQVGGFDEQMWTAEEYDLTLRMASAGYKFGYIDRVVYRYRTHAEQKSGVYWSQDYDTKLYRFEYIEQLQARYLDNHRVISR